MNLLNKKLIFLGDSITESFGVKDYNNTYHQVIKELYGCSECVNYGICGTRIAKQTNATRDCTIFDIYYSLRVPTMPKDADLVFVLGGTNDYLHGDSKIGDANSSDDRCFKGALNNLYKKLIERYSQKRIIILTPLHCLNEDEPHAPEGRVLSDYVNAIKEIASLYKLTVIDLYNDFKFDPLDRTVTDDGVHPNDNGSRKLGEFLGKRLSEME